jgi:hypothetical protein
MQWFTTANALRTSAAISSHSLVAGRQLVHRKPLSCRVAKRLAPPGRGIDQVELRIISQHSRGISIVGWAAGDRPVEHRKRGHPAVRITPLAALFEARDDDEARNTLTAFIAVCARVPTISTGTLKSRHKRHNPWAAIVAKNFNPAGKRPGGAFFRA